MIDNKLIRENITIVKTSLKKRGLDSEIVGEWLELDKELKELKQECDKLRHERNILSQRINELKKKNEANLIGNVLKDAKEIPGKIKAREERILRVEQQLKELSSNLPNILDGKVPFGESSDDNKVVRRYGSCKLKNAKSHVEILENLELLDLKTSAKISGEGFYVLKGDLSLLQRALINFFLDYHKKKRIECNVPILANYKTAFGTAHLPKFEQDMYKTTDNLFLIPTSEMSLTNLHQECVLDESELPLRYCSYTPCFRIEAGKHGTETRGLYRLHQFDKVEMVSFCLPEQSEKELNEMVKDAETLLKMLKIPFRSVLLCSGDTGFASSITYDIETYSPFLKKYLETSSISNCRDFQARRMNTKFLRKKTNQREYVHTLNGSGLALPRLMISLIECNQQADGSIKIPQVLHKYTGFKIIKAKKK